MEVGNAINQFSMHFADAQDFSEFLRGADLVQYHVVLYLCGHGSKKGRGEPAAPPASSSHHSTGRAPKDNWKI